MKIEYLGSRLMTTLHGLVMISEFSAGFNLTVTSPSSSSAFLTSPK